ncbi:MAG TPA: ABC transporter ATP-binding protein [Methanomassiliicoccales archaeon]|nr:ABC transporter ATP-binding protein [Methanomassiliicoccales archaeon]
MTEPMLETRGLSYIYANGTIALRDFSISIPKGKKTVILGSNGSGKSTLFLHFNGVLKPKSGKVFYGGKELSYNAKSLAILREDVAVVLQNPDDQIFSTTVEEDVAFGPLNLGLDKEEIDGRVEEALFLVDLESVRERPTQQLSFGQRKRVALAGALAMKPKVLMMDEPTAGLDSRMVHEVLELADELNQSGMTVLMSTHDVETAYSWADELRVMDAGRLVYSGLPDEFLSDERRVHSLGLVRPALYEMYLRTKSVGLFTNGSPPRDVEEMAQKLWPSGSRAGSIRLIEVREVGQGKELKEEVESWKGPTGAFGTTARRMAHVTPLNIEYPFNALEGLIRRSSQGDDSLLLVDSALVPFVKARLSHLEKDFGLMIRLV